MREFNAPASFVVGEQDNVVSAVYENAATHPDYPIYQRLIDGVWTNVSCAQAADQIRSVARGLIARGVVGDYRAERLLVEERLPVAEVAHQLGYHDVSNFSRAFRRWTGRTPREFRDRFGR